MKLNVPVLSQRDSRWANEKLGNSNLTIDGYGCVLVSMTMLSLYYGRQIDVPTFNKATIDAKGFKGANYDWYSIATLFPDIKFTSWKDYPLDPAPIDSIKAQIEAGKPVIVWVDINPNQPGNQQHFVILIGVEGDDFWIEKTICEANECLKSENLPESGDDCDYCKYRSAVRKFEK